MSCERPCLTRIICCSVFLAEVEQCLKTHWPDMPLIALSSMLHMRPERLAAQLHSAVGRELKEGHEVMLAYGDCCGGMAAIESQHGVARTYGSNCCEILLGRDVYRQLSREGAFFLLPEWAGRWREVFEAELGFDAKSAPGFMGDMHRRLVYLDTGIEPVPTDALKACAEYCGLPWEVISVSLEPLRRVIEEALARLQEVGTAT